MPAKNIYHDGVIQALLADGWTITHDPLKISYGGKDLFVDLGAERQTIAAERQGQRIAVEVQSFLGASPVRDLQEAVGQYEVYRAVLAKTEPDRIPFLAVPRRVHDGILSDTFGKMIVSSLELKLLIFDEHQSRVVQWIEPTNTEPS
jgi:hypothetical protein